MSEEKKIELMSSDDIRDLGTPGAIVTVTQEYAEQYAFEDDAVPLDDAFDAASDPEVA